MNCHNGSGTLFFAEPQRQWSEGGTLLSWRSFRAVPCENWANGRRQFGNLIWLTWSGRRVGGEVLLVFPRFETATLVINGKAGQNDPKWESAYLARWKCRDMEHTWTHQNISSHFRMFGCPWMFPLQVYNLGLSKHQGQGTRWMPGLQCWLSQATGQPISCGSGECDLLIHWFLASGFYLHINLLYIQ